DSFGLNMDFDKQLAKIHATEQNKSIENPKDQSRNLGVCSLRSYWRKNSIFYMYREYQEATNDAK
ncbi:MAG TPA: hypothetical protein VN132_09370, partial [Bdellovibrio sp.]|nr:hypothetical protein [Bdellovibrio sp.]